MRQLLAHQYNFFSQIGSKSIDFWGRLRKMIHLVFYSLYHGFQYPALRTHSFQLTLSFLKQNSIPVLLVIAAIGAMIATQSLTLARLFGMESLLSPLVSATIIKEIAPGFTLMMIAFQTGAGITADLASMRNRHEIEALEVFGIDSAAWLLAPRIIAICVAAQVLNLFAILIGNYSAFLSTVYLYDLPYPLFVHHINEGFNVNDLMLSQLKSFVFALYIGTISVYYGYHSPSDMNSIGKSTNRTVVVSVIGILSCNYIFNSIVYALTHVTD